MTTDNPLRFEREICSRCLGTGHYSYNSMTGSTCFKCHGKREVLTPRGRKALEWFRAQSTVPMSAVTLGQRVMMDGGWFTVREIITESGNKSKVGDQWVPMYELRGKNMGICATPDHKVQLKLPAAEHNALLAKAIEFQNTLTERGKPRKERKSK